MTPAEKAAKVAELERELAAVKDQGVRIDPLAGPSTPNLVQPPGAGGWVPPTWMPLVAGILAATCASVAGVLLAPGAVTGAAIGAAVLLGLSGGVSAFFGIKSAGPRRD